MTGSDRAGSRTDAAAADAFAFGMADMQLQGLRNILVLATLPWTAMLALGAELAAGCACRPRR